MKLFRWAAIAVLCMTGRHASCSTAPFNLVITEIMADPSPVIGLPDAEYVEIFNRGSTPVNLSGWTLFDGSVRTLPARVLQPGQYAIICNDDDTALFTGVLVFLPVSSISLTNGGEKISLRDETGNPVDSVEFTIDWFNGSPKEDGGWSLERIDVSFTCLSELNWKPSSDPAGGTPGLPNSVAGTIQDPVPPALLRAYCPDSITVTLVFSEALDSSALVPGNYDIKNAPAADSVRFSTEGRSKIVIGLTQPILPGQTGQVRVAGVSDCAGNPIGSDASARFGLADSLACGSLVINEILFHPHEGGVDFIELYHGGKTIADLRFLTVSNYDSETGLPEDAEVVCEDPWLVFPGDYIVLTESPEKIAAGYPSSYPYRMVAMENLPPMNVDEGVISVSCTNRIADSVYYSATYHFEMLQDAQGISLEKIRPEWDASNQSSWHSASPVAGSATPGNRNSQFLSDVQVNKNLSVFPEIFSPDNDGTDDVVSFTVTAGKPGYVATLSVFDSGGRVVYYQGNQLLASGHSSFTWDGVSDSGLRASSGIYVAFLDMFHPEGDVKQYKAAFVLAGSRKQ
jgi:hypothetical protein